MNSEKQRLSDAVDRFAEAMKKDYLLNKSKVGQVGILIILQNMGMLPIK